MTSFKNAMGLAPALKLVLLASLVASSLIGCKKDENTETAPATFYIDTLKAAQVVPEEFNSWGFPSKKLFKFEICPKDIALMAPIFDQPFEVRDEQGARLAVKTDHRGCFRWDEHHSYDHFAPETFINIKRTVVAKGVHAGAVEANVALNPWADQVIDLRYDVPQVMEKALTPTAFSANLIPGKNKSASLDLKTVTLQFLPMDYNKWEVTPSLDLTVVHNYRLRFEPKVVRKTLKTPTTTETPSKGRVRITVLVVDEGKNPNEITEKQYVTHLQRDVEMQIGGVIEDIELKFPGTIQSVASRMRAFVKIEAPRDLISVGEINLTSPFGPLPGSAEMKLVPTTVDAEAALNTILGKRKESTIAAMRPLELFAEVSGFRQLTTANWDEAQPLDRVLQGVQLQQVKASLNGKVDKSTGLNIQKRLCHEIYGPGARQAQQEQGLDVKAKKPTRRWSWASLWGKKEQGPLHPSDALAQCLRNPQNAMFVEVRELVDDLVNSTPRRTGLVQIEEIKVQSSFSITESQSESSGKNSRLSGGYSLDGGISFGLGYDLGWPGFLKAENPAKPGDPDTSLFGATGGGKASVGAKLNIGAKGGWSQEWFKTWSRSVEEKTSNSVSASMSRAVIVEAYALDIDVVARKCMIVAPALDVDGDEASGAFVCGDDLVKKTTREAYYFMNQSGSGKSPLVDDAALSEMPWRMFIRGSHRYQALKQVLGDSKLELVLEPIKEDETVEATRLSKKVKEVFENTRMTQDFPGMLTPPLRAK